VPHLPDGGLHSMYSIVVICSAGTEDRGFEFLPGMCAVIRNLSIATLLYV
jgi:hypothetical protein